MTGDIKEHCHVSVYHLYYIGKCTKDKIPSSIYHISLRYTGGIRQNFKKLGCKNIFINYYRLSLCIKDKFDNFENFIAFIEYFHDKLSFTRSFITQI